MKEELISVAEYAAKVKQSKVYIYRMIKKGKIKSIKKYGVILVNNPEENGNYIRVGSKSTKGN